ncbi:hypothetical protein Q669_31185 [Labrenzia sp. C1B10]|nr:hypothetical protein Q669_31185 [Labrenzia sp. C1B10]ERS04161.1 hypothetical protein Q675_30865 [Labrenzia sp. C1B70]
MNDFVQHVSIQIDGSPEPVFLASNNDADLIKRPDITGEWLLAE